MRSLHLGLLAGLTLAGGASAQELGVTIHAITTEGIGEPIGSLTTASTPSGATFTGQVQGLPADTGKVVAGGAAGKHWDPQDTAAHRGPEGDGHMGDVPLIVANSAGTADIAATAPRIAEVEQLHGKALMIHAGGDN